MLRFSSCQAPIADAFCQSLIEFIADRLATDVEWVADIPWQERERQLDRGDIQVCWICGLPYVRKTQIRLIAAPVMMHSRYSAQPLYYSDVVVRSDSDFHSFEDLRGARWAYNEPGSHSGYNVVRYHLASKGFGADYFGEVVESGSHQRSLRMILDGTIDASAIDSTVLEMAFSKDPSLPNAVRTIATLGPSPAPPWVVHHTVPLNVQDALQRAFLSMHAHARGKEILNHAGMLRFAAVSDRDYDPIRDMERVASSIRWF